MTTTRRGSRLSAAAVLLLAFAASAAPPEPKKVRLGVFLPTTMVDGQERFKLAEELGKALEASAGKPVTVKNFGRYEDFLKAKGSLDVAVVDAWVAAHLKLSKQVVASGQVAGNTHQQWALISSLKGSVRDLAGKRLALPRGVNTLDSKFVANVIFVGDVEFKHFKLQPVPNAESALRMVEAKGADVALVPLMHAPRDARIVYKSPRIPGVVVVDLGRAGGELAAAFIAMSPVGKLEKFTAAKERDMQELEALLLSGPPRRQPLLAEAPRLNPEPGALVNLREVRLTLPAFLEYVEPSKETPDD